MPAVISYYQATLKLKRLTSPIKIDNSDAQWCADVDTTTTLNNGLNADLVLLVTATRDTTSNYIAAASACLIDSTNNR